MREQDISSAVLHVRTHLADSPSAINAKEDGTAPSFVRASHLKPHGHIFIITNSFSKGCHLTAAELVRRGSFLRIRHAGASALPQHTRAWRGKTKALLCSHHPCCCCYGGRIFLHHFTTGLQSIFLQPCASSKMERGSSAHLNRIIGPTRLVLYYERR